MQNFPLAVSIEQHIIFKMIPVPLHAQFQFIPAPDIHIQFGFQPQVVNLAPNIRFHVQLDFSVIVWGIFIIDQRQVIGSESGIRNLGLPVDFGTQDRLQQHRCRLIAPFRGIIKIIIIEKIGIERGAEIIEVAFRFKIDIVMGMKIAQRQPISCAQFPG